MKPERRFKLLAAVALADGELAPEEEAFLLTLADRMGVPRGLARAIVTSLLVDSSESGLQPAVPPDGGRALFDDLVALVRVDGVVTETERHIVLHLAAAFGVSRAEALAALNA